MLFTKKDRKNPVTETEQDMITEPENDFLEDQEDQENDEFEFKDTSDSDIEDEETLDQSDKDDSDSDYGDGMSVRQAEQSIFDIDDSSCMWNYVNKVCIQGRLYFNDRIKVSNTALKYQVASFNLLIKKETKNGVKKHRIYVKSYNKNIIKWLQQQKIGTWVRVEGRLEAQSGNNYVNATSITPFTEEHMRAMFDDNPNRLLDWEQVKKEDQTVEPNNEEARSKLQQIKRQTQVMISSSKSINVDNSDEDNKEPAVVATIDFELTPEEMSDICKKTAKTLIYYTDDDDDDDDDYEENENKKEANTVYPGYNIPNRRPEIELDPDIENTDVREEEIEEDVYGTPDSVNSDDTIASAILTSETEEEVNVNTPVIRRPETTQSKQLEQSRPIEPLKPAPPIPHIPTVPAGRFKLIKKSKESETRTGFKSRFD